MPNSTVEYCICSGSDFPLSGKKRAYQKLEAEVAEKIAEGWEPLGGVAAARYSDSDGYMTMYQAMTRRFG